MATIEQLSEQLFQARKQIVELQTELETGKPTIRKVAEPKFNNHGIEKILHAIDALEIPAIQLVSAKSLQESISVPIKLLHDYLEANGITVIDPIDERFNPELHQAMSMQPNDAREKTVTGVIQKGYIRNNGYLLRPALVILS